MLNVEGLNQTQTYHFLMSTGSLELGFEVVSIFGHQFWNPENALGQNSSVFWIRRQISLINKFNMRNVWLSARMCFIYLVLKITNLDFRDHVTQVA